MNEFEALVAAMTQARQDESYIIGEYNAAHERRKRAEFALWLYGEARGWTHRELRERVKALLARDEMGEGTEVPR